MVGSSIANDHKFIEGVTTIVLIGCTGTGKSSTGNSIIGQKVFPSKSSFGGFTTSCKLQTTQLQDGQVLNVIDTPGLFNSSMSPRYIAKEIVRCIDMARDGIHAFLMVVSLKGRFTEEQVAAVETMKHLFGTGIADYMIVAFTGGDELEEDETLDDRLSLSCSCPDAVMELLEKCGNRRVLFDNKTKDEGKKVEQLHQLFNLIGGIVGKKGKPFTNELFLEFKNEDAKMESGHSKKASEKQTHLLFAEKVHENLEDRKMEIIKKPKEDLKKAKLEVEILKLKAQLADAQRRINTNFVCAVM